MQEDRTGSRANSLKLGVSSGASKEPYQSNGATIKRELEYIDMRQLFRDAPLRAEQILENYYGKYILNFTDPNERISMETLRFLLKEEGSSSNLKIALLGGEIAGGSHYRIIDAAPYRLGYEAFIWIDPALRGQPEKFGAQLYRAATTSMKEQGAVGIIGELNDPHLMTEEQKRLDGQSGITPENRVAFWKKLGRLAVDAPFSQPALEEGKSPVLHVMMTIQLFDAKIDSLPAALVGKIYCDIYRPQVLGRDVRGDPAYLSLQEWLAERSVVPLIPLDEKRSYLKQQI